MMQRNNEKKTHSKPKIISEHTKLNKYNGVVKFLNTKGIEKNHINPLIITYGKVKELNKTDIYDISIEIQKDFNSFSSWFKKEFEYAR